MAIDTFAERIEPDSDREPDPDRSRRASRAGCRASRVGGPAGPEAADQLRAFISGQPPGRPVPAQPSQPPHGPGLDIAPARGPDLTEWTSLPGGDAGRA